jgi:hypothetical protein
VKVPFPVTVVQFADSEAFRCVAKGDMYADGGVHIHRPFECDDGWKVQGTPRDVEFCEIVHPDGTIQRDGWHEVTVPSAGDPIAGSGRFPLRRSRRVATGIARVAFFAVLSCADVFAGSRKLATDVSVVHRRHLPVADIQLNDSVGTEISFGALLLAVGRSNQ